MSTWLITGASRGFGRALVGAAVAAGDNVIAAARDATELHDRYHDTTTVLPVVLDVTNADDASRAVARGIERFGVLDVVVNNAGFGMFGSVEETPDSAARALFDTNVFGLLNVTRAVLPTLRQQRHGHIINMSSSAGVTVSAGRGLYGASKFAVEAISEALRDELAPLGIAVTAVEPGSFRTEFLSDTSRRASPVQIADYRPTVGALLDTIGKNGGKQPGDPHKAVAAIREIAGRSDAPLRLPLGSDTVQLIENKLGTMRAELDACRELALSTGFPSQ